MKTTTKTNTFFGIIAALIAVIFTLAAFTACTNPAEETEPDYTFPTAEEGKLTIENQTGKPNINYKDFVNKVIQGYELARINKNDKLTPFFNNGGTIKVILDSQVEGYSVLGGHILTITLNADGFIQNVPEENLVINLSGIFNDAIVPANLTMLNNSFTKTHIASLFKAGRARA
jgi:hypothetical protein